MKINFVFILKVILIYLVSDFVIDLLQYSNCFNKYSFLSGLLLFYFVSLIFNENIK